MASSSKSTSKSNKSAKSGKTKKGLSKEVAIVVGILCLIILELCNFKVFGVVGGWLRSGMGGAFGAIAWVFPVLVCAAFMYAGLSEKPKRSKFIFGAVLLLFLCAMAFLFKGDEYTSSIIAYMKEGAANLQGGGLLGSLLAVGLYYALSETGAYIIVILMVIFSLFVLFKTPVISGFKSIFAGDDEEPVRKETGRKEEPAPVRKKQTKTNQKETIIRIVDHTGDRNNKVKQGKERAELKRSANKAQNARSQGVKPVRSSNIAKGITGNVNIKNNNAGGDELHEITHVVPARKQVEPEKKSSVMSVTEITAAEPKKSSTISVTNVEKSAAKPAAAPKAPEKPARSSQTAKQAEPERVQAAAAPTGKGDDTYQLPPMNLLNRARSSAESDGDIDTIARKLEVVLENFGINAKVIEKQVGPSVTRFELQPEIGTRVNKITSLADDLKLNLAVKEIRIEAPIPGKAAVGIEIPNKFRQTVTLRELLEDSSIINHKSKIAFAAGKDISGNVIVNDIAKMPHLLVAGTTGSGKSVFLNSIIMCILYRAKPTEVGLIIVDPKKVEFGVYQGIPHLMRPVVNDPGQAVSTLRWAVNEMTIRYQRMQLSGVRDFKSYNEKFDNGTISKEEENPKRMHQIVIVIDELADLMMVAAKEAESLICRLAQLARAAGIHLIIATQRPSVDVVTGLIKANIPARVALKVASGVDSRTIIDLVGAEKLLGNGDMLFKPTDYPQPLRVQGAFVSDEEVEKTVDFLIKHKTRDYYAEEAEAIEACISSGNIGTSLPGADASSEEGGGNNYDEFFREAGLLCIEQGKASSSMLQRRFNIGFNRAARIIDQLCEFGAVGEANGAKPREILVDSYTFKEMCEERL